MRYELDLLTVSAVGDAQRRVRDDGVYFSHTMPQWWFVAQGFLPHEVRAGTKIGVSLNVLAGVVGVGVVDTIDNAVYAEVECPPGGYGSVVLEVPAEPRRPALLFRSVDPRDRPCVFVLTAVSIGLEVSEDANTPKVDP